MSDDIPGIDPHDPEALQLLDALASALRWARLSGADTVVRSPWADELRWDSAPTPHAPTQARPALTPGSPPSRAPDGHQPSVTDRADRSGTMQRGAATAATVATAGATDPRSSPQRDGRGLRDTGTSSLDTTTARTFSRQGQAAETANPGFSLRLRDRSRPPTQVAVQPPIDAGATASERAALAARAHRPELSLADIRGHVDSCTRCPLHKACAGRVHAFGPARARLLIVVDGPGAAELAAGMPLGTNEGQTLAKALSAAGLTIDDAFVVPIVRCAPAAVATGAAPRDPSADELGACARYLAAEMASVRPEVMWILGTTAARFLLRADATAELPSLRQRWHSLRGVDTIVSWSMRDLAEVPARKRDTWADLQEIQRRLAKT